MKRLFSIGVAVAVAATLTGCAATPPTAPVPAMPPVPPVQQQAPAKPMIWRSIFTLQSDVPGSWV